MAIRVTSVALQVLHVGKRGYTGYNTSAYDHNYSAYDLSAESTYDLEVGQTLEARMFTSSYFLAGFDRYEGVTIQGNSTLNAYQGLTGAPTSGHYALNAYRQENGRLTAGYKLEAYLTLDASVFGHYALNAFEPRSVVLNSMYDVNVYLLQQGYVGGLYDVDTYTDLLMELVASYDYLTYEQNDQTVFTGTHDLLAWESAQQAFTSAYQLQTLIAATTRLNSQYTVEVYEALTKKFGVHYDLEAFKALQARFTSKYSLLTYQQLQQRFGSTYALEVYKLLDGLFDSTHALNAYQQADVQTGFHYGLDVYVAAQAALDSQYLIEALQQLEGSFQGTYLLDTTQVLYTWVVNQNTGAPSRYENYDFDAFAQIGEDYLAARGDAIYLLEGSADGSTPIDAIATIGLNDMGDPRLKRVVAAYLGLDSAGQVHLTLTSDAGQVSGPYELRQDPRAAKTERAKFRKGIKSRYWQVDIENVDGGEATIDGLELETDVVANRRLKR